MADQKKRRFLTNIGAVVAVTLGSLSASGAELPVKVEAPKEAAVKAESGREPASVAPPKLSASKEAKGDAIANKEHRGHSSHSSHASHRSHVSGR